MKKLYEKPELTTVSIKPRHMMAGSPGYGGTTTATSGNAAKQSISSWDDDVEPGEE